MCEHRVPFLAFHRIACLQAVLSGDNLPADIDLLDLVQVRPRPHYVVVNGEVDVGEPQQPESITFTTGESSVELSLNDTIRSLELYFRTIESDGLLLHAAHPVTGDALDVEMFDGKLYVVVVVRRRPAKKYLLEAAESTSGRVDDGRQHRVRINFGRGGLIRLRLDDSEERTERVAGVDGSIDLGAVLYIGGIDDVANLPWQVWSRGNNGKFYRGCMWGLRINGGQAIRLGKIIGRRRGIELGCQTMPAHCVATGRPEVCFNGAPCQQVWYGPVCDCSETAFTGQMCNRGWS
jgi:ribosomal protein L27